LIKSWQKGVAIFFVTGVVSGTALSFELGLLWLEFMKHAVPIIGMPFSLEDAVFFVEAIAAILQPISEDLSAEGIAERQPVKTCCYGSVL